MSWTIATGEKHYIAFPCQCCKRKTWVTYQDKDIGEVCGECRVDLMQAEHWLRGCGYTHCVAVR